MINNSAVFIKKLFGHSGCNLALYKKDNVIFLRKDAGNISYNKRLKKQCAKQKCFVLEKVKTPKVIEYGYNNQGVFYFDMEFVNGLTMAKYMEQIKIKEIVDLMGLLFKSLPISQGKQIPQAQDIFQDKVLSLEAKLSKENAVILAALDKLKKFDFSMVYQSPCCGDLTLENIILSSSGIYVIDLLDSFYNSWMIDIAKLLQDLELGWSYRKEERSYNLNLRLATAKQALFDNLLATENGFQNIIAIYHILLLNVLRIYPYTHDQKTLDFLNQALAKVLIRIKELEEK